MRHVVSGKCSVRLMFLTVGQVFTCRCGEGFHSPYAVCLSGRDRACIPAGEVSPYMSLWRRVPFALCALLLWHSLTRERVKGVLRHALNNPGSRQGKSPRRGPFALCRLPVGSGPSLHPYRPSPPPASLRADPVNRQRLIDFHAGPTASLQHCVSQINSFCCQKTNN